MEVDVILGWIAIGAAASLGAMIWPFRRGFAGVLLNLVIGIGGAVAIGLASYLVLPQHYSKDTPARLIFAAGGAIGSLLLAHVASNRHTRDQSAPHT